MTPRRALAALAIAFTLEAGVAASGRGATSPTVTIKNFGTVREGLHRGAQPRPDEYRQLAALGVDAVVDLRDDPEPWAREAAGRAGMRYTNIPLDDKAAPDDEDARRFLALVTRKLARGRALYVHCAGGRHRTGSMIAVYRIAVDGWTAEAAYAEMKAYDYYSRFGHGGHKEYVLGYYRRMSFAPASVPLAYVPGRPLREAAEALDPALAAPQKGAAR